MHALSAEEVERNVRVPEIRVYERCPGLKASSYPARPDLRLRRPGMGSEASLRTISIGSVSIAGRLPRTPIVEASLAILVLGNEALGASAVNLVAIPDQPRLPGLFGPQAPPVPYGNVLCTTRRDVAFRSELRLDWLSC
jgi:hypothetical protein